MDRISAITPHLSPAQLEVAHDDNAMGFVDEDESQPSRVLGRVAAAVAANVWAQYNGYCVGGDLEVDQIIRNSSSEGKLQI